MRRVCATAPAKLILLGEHAVNRGQSALAVSVGLYASCAVSIDDGADERIRLMSAGRVAYTSRLDIAASARAAERLIAATDGHAIRALLQADWWAPVTYVLAAFGDALPDRMRIEFTSRIPATGGLGSGAACFAALTSALAHLLGADTTPAAIAACARRGDQLAHGGIASGLDTATSTYGGAIRFSVAEEASRVAAAPGLAAVIGDTGVRASTAVVNGRVRDWLAEQPSRRHYFAEIGLLSRLAEPALAAGDWDTLGRLINLNQLLLERVGVSSPELERLNDAALAAGAYGAKLSGSGGGGIMFALVPEERSGAVARAIERAGGAAFTAPLAVEGVRIEP